jgi:uridine kinase
VRQVASARYVVAVAGPVGGGKSTLVSGLAARLADAATVHFDHYERITGQPIESIAEWMREGADLNRVVVPQLAEDLQALKNGRAVADPLTRAEIPARKYILFETQFGRQHTASGRHIDFLVWLETPLDIALARKLRQFTLGLQGARSRSEIDRFVPWLHTYLDNYVSVVGKLLRMQRNRVAANADLVLDGTREPLALQREAQQAILSRFA